MTHRATTEPQPHLRVWDSSNLSESFPGLVMPLTFSIARRGYQLAYQAQAYSAGMSWYDIEAHARMFDSMVAIFNGRMYYNLRSWYDFIALFPGSRNNQQFLDDQIATQGQAVRQPNRSTPLGRKLKFGARVAYRALFFSVEQNDFYRRFGRFEQAMAKLPEGGDFLTLLERYALVEQTIVPHFGRTVDNDFFVMVYHGWIKRLLRGLGTDADRTNLLGAMKGVASADQATALYDLAAQLRADHESRRLLEQSQFQALAQHLSGTEAEAHVHQYIQTFGHRFAGDQKIEAPNPTLEPAGVYRLMRAYVLLDPAELQQRQTQAQRQAARIERAVAQQLPALRRPIYRLLLSRLKHHLRLRERNRLLRGKAYGYLRELFPKVGQALVGEGKLADPADIFYLEISEIYGLAQGTLPVNDLPDRIESRRNAYKRYADMPMPVRFSTTGIPQAEQFQPPTTSDAKSLQGLVSSPGDVTGRVVVLDTPAIPDEPFDILVTSHTDPGWTPLIALAKGVIVEHGGLLSHAAIVTRELGIPSIISVANATKILKTGMTVRLNSKDSAVEILGV
jgi:phosphohistidine swiveling domain-containing protein